MSYLSLHDTDYIKTVNTQYNNGSGMVDLTSANITSTGVVNSFVQGAILLATDTNKLYLHNGTNVVKVPLLNDAVCLNGEIITNSDEIVWL